MVENLLLKKSDCPDLDTRMLDELNAEDSQSDTFVPDSIQQDNYCMLLVERPCLSDRANLYSYAYGFLLFSIILVFCEVDCLELSRGWE